MLKTLLSGVLMLLPVAVTFGVYVGVEFQRVVDVVNGKIPAGYAPTGPDGRPTSPEGNLTITTDTYCQKAYGIEPYPFRYILNPNQWGDPENTGALCMNVTSDPTVKSTETYASNFTITWRYPQGSETQPVHAFPNAKLNSSSMPIQVGSISNLVLDVDWSYAVGDEAKNDTNEAELTAQNLNSNVCVDIFLSNTADDSVDPTKATYEVMVWLGHFGPSTQPIGYSTTPVATTIIGSTTFDLFQGPNKATGQQVFTWLASETTTSFSGDLAPLITQLSSLSLAPTAQSYLGYYAFGSEAFWASTNVTLSVQKLDLDINRS